MSGSRPGDPELVRGQGSLGSCGMQLGLDGAGTAITAPVALDRQEYVSDKMRLRLDLSQDLTRCGHWELDLASNRLTIGEGFRQICGPQQEHGDYTMEQYLAAVPQDDRDRVLGWLRQTGEGKSRQAIEHRLAGSKGSEIVVLNIAQYMGGQGGQPATLVGAVLDITQCRQRQDMQRIMTQVFESAANAIMVTGSGGGIVMVNPAFRAITGFRPQEVVGLQPSILSPGHDGGDSYLQIWPALEEFGCWNGEITSQRKNGQTYPVRLSISLVADANDGETYHIWSFSDISESKAREEKIAFQAYHDSLTGLPNRLLFQDRLRVAMAHAQRDRQGLAVLFLDLDRFKHINDSLGHAMGDALLIEVAGRLSSLVREEDTVARLGGDEFAMLLMGGEDPEYAVQVAERIMESLSQPIELSGHLLYASASAGITVFPHDGATPEILLQNADLAMYRAKDEGRGCYQLFTPAMHKEMMCRLELENDIRLALERQEFVIHYQPQVDLTSGETIGLEALVRWDRPGVGLVGPDEFISLAEETGQIVQIGEWVLRNACMQTQKWHQAGHRLKIAVNLSPRQFLEGDLVHQVRRALDTSGLPSQFLELEVTENIVMQNVDQAIVILNELSGLGVSLALDDFGRGYSSLYYLKRFPMNSLKIDGSFVRDLQKGSGEAAIVNTIISMSRSLNLRVVAEGVETDEQLAFLRAGKCDEMQGFLFSRPVPPQEITGLLQENRKLP